MDNLMKRFFSDGINNEIDSDPFNKRKTKLEQLQEDLDSFIIDNEHSLNNSNENYYNYFSDNNPMVGRANRNNPLNNSNIIPPNYNFVNEKVFPTFDNLILTAPKTRPQEILDDNKIFAIKNQMLEEKIKLLETKQSMLESINKNIMLNTKDQPATKLELPKYGNENILSFLIDMKKEISEKICKSFIYIIVTESMLNKQAFAKIDMDIKKLKSDVYNMFENFDNNQKMQMDNIKYVLEHSGSKRLNRLSKRLLGKRIENEKIQIGGRRSLARPEGQIQTEQLQQENVKYAKPTNQQIEDAKKEIKRKKTIAKNKNYVLTVNEESEDEYSQKNENVVKERRISVLDRNDLQPVLNENKKGSNFLKPDDFPLKISLNQPIDNATEIENLKRNLSPNGTNSFFEDENFIPKNSNNARRKGKFFYD